MIAFANRKTKTNNIVHDTVNNAPYAANIPLERFGNAKIVSKKAATIASNVSHVTHIFDIAFDSKNSTTL